MVPANSFIYNSFQHSFLEEKAKATRSSFFSFVRHTFESLVQQGKDLWQLLDELLSHLGKSEGKATFEAWLDSDEFGASRYIARAAMQLSAWYNTLPLKVQRLVTENCHRWSVAALCELPKLTVNLVKELVSSHKKHTVKSVREAAPMDEEEWAGIAQRYGLSESELCSVREQARIFAIAETPEDATTARIRRGHAMKALEHLGFRPGPKSDSGSNNSSSPASSSASSSSGGGSKKRDRLFAVSAAMPKAIATYSISEEDARKLTELAKRRGVTPNQLISQLLAGAPEFQPKEEEPAPAASNMPKSANEQAYQKQIDDLQKKLAAMKEQKRILEEKVAEARAKKAAEEAAKNEEIAKEAPENSPSAPAEWVEATVEEIEAIAPETARSVDVRSALAAVGVATLLLVQRLVKGLKKAAAKASDRDWGEAFAFEESQEIDNWEPA